MTTRADIRGWLERGKSQGATHLLVCTDTFDWSDYPKFAQTEKEARAVLASPGEMQKVTEIYKLSDDWDEQLRLPRCCRL